MSTPARCPLLSGLHPPVRLSTEHQDLLAVPAFVSLFHVLPPAQAVEASASAASVRSSASTPGKACMGHAPAACCSAAPLQQQQQQHEGQRHKSQASCTHTAAHIAL